MDVFKKTKDGKYFICPNCFRKTPLLMKTADGGGVYCRYCGQEGANDSGDLIFHMG